MLAAADLDALTVRLADAGFVTARDEAAELAVRAAGDAELLETLTARRLAGEPLAWITGRIEFCGVEVRVETGVYVPRRQSELLVGRAVERLPADGVAIDLCTGSGAIAKALMAARPGVRVIGTDVDARAVACARANGVRAHRGDLLGPLPRTLQGHVDVVVGVVPYVPAGDLPLLQRDTFTFESPLAYDGGPEGIDVLRRALAGSADFLRPGGTLLLELGREQAELLAGDLSRHGYEDALTLIDEDGDIRGIEAVRAG